MIGWPEAFEIGPTPALVALVGAGGKTSLMFALARALGPGVVVTATTRLGLDQIRLAPAVCFLEGENGRRRPLPPGVVAGTLRQLEALLARHGTVLVLGGVAGDKALGVPPAWPARLLARPGVRHVLVEADGAGGRSIKAPADHEPALPAGATLVAPVMGIDALAGRLAEVAHRPERVMALLQPRFAVTGQDRLTPAMAAALLVHPEGGRKGVPPGVPTIPFINKVDSPDRLAAARQIARHVWRQTPHPPRPARLVLGAAGGPASSDLKDVGAAGGPPLRAVARRVTAVILAAGRSTRMGQTKQLLPWKGSTVLGHTVAQAQASGVADVLVVTGHEAEAVAAVATAAGATTVLNPAYATGEMITSLQAALRALPPDAAGVLVLLADQPMVTPDIMDALLQAYWEGAGTLLAPSYNGRRGNPVLMDRAYFGELLALPPAANPRWLLQRHPDRLRLVPVASAAVLQDLDRPADYDAWRPDTPEGN